MTGRWVFVRGILLVGKLHGKENQQVGEGAGLAPPSQCSQIEVLLQES